MLSLASPARAASGTPAPNVPRVVIESGGRSYPVVVEVADDEASRERGLMFRERLEPGHGMLFVFEEEGEHPFWMKNTLIPLDMVFIDGVGRVSGVVARAQPGSLEPRSGGRCRYVLEVPGGWAAERGVKKGDRVRFEGPVLRRRR